MFPSQSAAKQSFIETTEILQELYDNLKNAQEKNDTQLIEDIKESIKEYEILLKEIEKYLAPKYMDYRKLMSKILSDAYINALLHAILQHQEIQDAVSRLKSTFQVKTVKEFNCLIKTQKETIKALISEYTSHLLYVKLAIYPDPQLLIDYNWIMQEEKEDSPILCQECFEIFSSFSISNENMKKSLNKARFSSLNEAIILYETLRSVSQNVEKE